MDNEIRVPVIKVHQEIGDLYVGVMNGRDLYDLAEVDRIRLESLEIPKYAGFQRALDPQRVAAIRDYLNTPHSTLPNAIIASVDSEHLLNWDDLQSDQGVSTLVLERERGALTIIDGQHRAAALDKAPNDFDVIVSMFVDLEMIQAAAIFAKINSTQKSVNPSIAFQLFGYADWRSPQKTAHEVAETLNTTPGSPFYRRLRMLGTKDDWTQGTLSQSTFAKGLMRLYTRDANRDENRLMRHQELDTYPDYPLRSYFQRRDDRTILETVWKFFHAVAETWPDQWNGPTEQSILTKTTGYNAFMEILKRWLIRDPDTIIKDTGVREAVRKLRDRFTAPQTRFLRSNYPAGHQGVVVLRDALLRELELA